MFRGPSETRSHGRPNCIQTLPIKLARSLARSNLQSAARSLVFVRILSLIHSLIPADFFPRDQETKSGFSRESEKFFRALANPRDGQQFIVSPITRARIRFCGKKTMTYNDLNRVWLTFILTLSGHSHPPYYNSLSPNTVSFFIFKITVLIICKKKEIWID